MPKYLIEIIMVVEAQNSQEAHKIADNTINIPIPDNNIENTIETLWYEEIVQITNQKPR